MNIDEFIEHAKEKAREHRYHADFFESDNPMNTTCIKSAEDCEQLAGWLEKSKEYQQLEERLNKVYGDCDGLLLRVVSMLEKHPGIDMANNTLKSRLITDEDVDKWEEYKQLEEQDRLVKLPCKVGDTYYSIEVNTDFCEECTFFQKECYCDDWCNNKAVRDENGDTLINPQYSDEVFCKNHFYEINRCCFSNIDEIFNLREEFGKTVFLTKSEAEAKLEELRGNND